MAFAVSAWLLGAGLVLLKGGTQANEDFGTGLEEDLGFWLVHFFDIVAKMIDQFCEYLFDVGGVGFWTAGSQCPRLHISA